MKRLSVNFYRRDFTTPLSFPRVKIKPTSMSWNAIGGCDRAHLTAYGNFNSLWNMTNWLRAPVEILDWRGEKVWWGFINEVYVQIGAIKLGVSLADMANKIAVAYTGDGGQIQRFTTAWAQDDLSTSTFGIMELLATLNYGNEDIALAMRDTLLEERSKPIPVPEITDSGSSMSAGLELSGWFSTLDWKYYQQTAGLEAYSVTGQGVQEIGRLAGNQRIAQQFQVSSAWTASHVSINAKKEGAPADNLIIDLCADSSNEPGTVLSTATVLNADVPDSLSWFWATLAVPVNLSASTPYWIVVRRSGAVDADNYYKVNANEDLGYSGGVFRIYDGSDWNARDPDADMNFMVKGTEETTSQIENIATAAGQFLTGTVIKNSSGISSNQYRDGDTKALQEILALMAAGTSNKRRLLAKVTSSRELIVYEEPAYNAYSPDYYIDSKGKLMSRSGEMVLEHTGPVAGWAQMKDIFPPEFNSQLLADGTRFFIERAEFNVQNWKLRPEPKTIKSAWNVGAIDEG